MKAVLLITMLILSSSTFASPTKISQRLASGAIGCAPNSILISDYSPSSKNPLMNSVHTFAATCNDVKYYCSYLYPNPVACKIAADYVPETQEAKEEKLAEMETWKSNVLNKAIQNWEKPESLDGMVDSEISVKVNEKGQLLNLQWVKPTNVRKIDRSIVNAFKKAAPFNAPPDISSAFNGVLIVFPANQE